jgi:uncharacterized OB-fold protein
MSAAAGVAQRPIAADVFTWPSDDPHLIGSRCGACATVVFPAQDGCPKCGTPGMARTELSTSGTLWTWTSQDFLPKSPYAGPETEADFGGYLVGYVELPEGVRVITRLVDLHRADVEIGMALELAIVPFTVDPDGTEVVAYAFRPSAADRAVPS